MSTEYETVELNITQNYERIQILKETELESVEQLRHVETQKLYVCRRFQGDAEAFKKLIGVDSAHLPHIYEAASDGNFSIVLEEFIEGQTLEEVLQSGALPSRQVRSIGLQLCEALNALHDLGLVHLDIKPANIILNDNQAVLIDFMSARPAGDLTDAKEDRNPCMAPEQSGQYAADYRTDFYALGVLINLLLLGRNPSQIRPRGNWGTVVSRCTADNPENRFASANEVAAAIRNRTYTILTAAIAAFVVVMAIFGLKQLLFSKTYKGAAELEYVLDEETVRLSLYFETDNGVLVRKERLTVTENVGSYHGIRLCLEASDKHDQPLKDLFLSNLKQVTFQVIPMDGARPMQLSELPVESTDQAVLKQLVTYGPDCGSNEIVCRLSMKNGDTLKLRQTLTCKKR